MATELSPKGIRINCIAPGFIATEMSAKALNNDPERKGKALGRTPMGEVGQPSDIADAAVFLASDSSKYIAGCGIYYHFDYVGGPRNYKWLNTNNLARVWEEMHLAWEYGARQIWIANVGDIKPMELPVSFFLDYAWNPGKWNKDNLRDYYTHWAAQQFGEKYSTKLGQLLANTHVIALYENLSC
ncbi:MAG TPA: SDR family oxidoreductase [Flavisolibacter sp.]|nr:SDR family oxidoreductase [Flavisolibacter sp.]